MRSKHISPLSLFAYLMAFVTNLLIAGCAFKFLVPDNPNLYIRFTLYALTVSSFTTMVCLTRKLWIAGILNVLPLALVACWIVLLLTTDGMH